MVRLYKAFILPHFEYCIPLLVGIGLVQSKRIENASYYILRTLLSYAKSVPGAIAEYPSTVDRVKNSATAVRSQL